MASRKWSAINSGATFESLATTIVFFEDPKAALFGRRGKDGGQDARSGDGTRVFQAKHHERGSAAAALRDAKSEARKIEEYRKPNHSRYKQWAGVTHWRLVTNSTFNPTDKEKWDLDIVPLFAQIGLVADYWEKENLDALLDKHPEIHRSYFENETRIFLSIPEILDRLPEQEPFLHRGELGPFCGREAEKARIGGFLASDKHFFVVHGAGGTGKTRLIVDAGDEIAGEGEWQVLWTNIESMEATGAWFEGIVPERATLLLVDEPSDDRLMHRLAEQIGGRTGRTAKWKVIISVRSPKDPVLRFLRAARMKQRVDELALLPLPPTDAEEMCYKLLETGKLSGMTDEAKREAARQLSRRFARFPVWLTLAVRHLEDHGSLEKVPTDAETLADEYLDEIECNQSEVPRESVRAILRWVALIGPINRHDNRVMQYVGARIQVDSVADVGQRLEALVRRRALSARGAYDRLVELKPDVLRDHVLLRWLALDVGGQHPCVSPDGEELLVQVCKSTLIGDLDQTGRAILLSLARTEFILRFAGHELGLLRRFFSSLEGSVSTMTPAQRISVVNVIESIADLQPVATTSLLARLRREADQTDDGTLCVLSLAWPLLGAGMGAESNEEKDAVLRELCTLVEAEAELASALQQPLPNDGRRAASLIPRLIGGGPQFMSEYDENAKKISLELLDSLMRRAPSRGETELLRALIHPILDMERIQTWGDDRTFTYAKVAVVPGGAAWAARKEILARLKEALGSKSTPEDSRPHLWGVFAGVAHEDALEKLQWTRQVLIDRDPTFQELAAARQVWAWHFEFEDNAESKVVADALEDLYTANALVREFQSLLPFDGDLERAKLVCAEKASQLSVVASPNDISAFLDRAMIFGGGLVGPDLDDVARSLGMHAVAQQVVRHYIEEALNHSSDYHCRFAVLAASSWIAAVRAAAPANAHLVVSELLVQCDGDQRRAQLLDSVYGRIPPYWGFTAEERALIRNSRQVFANGGREAAYVRPLTISLAHDITSLQAMISDVLESLPADQVAVAIASFIETIYWVVREVDIAQLPNGFVEWVLTETVVLPGRGSIAGTIEHRLKRIVGRLGAPDVRWLPEALALQHRASPRHGAMVSKYIRAIGCDDMLNVEILAAIDRVLDFVKINKAIAFYLPDILKDVDPEGVVVPSLVAKRLAHATEEENVAVLARIGEAYTENSTPWRTIASAAIHAATRLGPQVVHSIYSDLGARRARSWGGVVGEVPRVFVAAVERARLALENESQGELRPFWEQRLALAEAELHEQQERAKEDRGE